MHSELTSLDKERPYLFQWQNLIHGSGGDRRLRHRRSFRRLRILRYDEPATALDAFRAGRAVAVRAGEDDADEHRSVSISGRLEQHTDLRPRELHHLVDGHDTSVSKTPSRLDGTGRVWTDQCDPSHCSDTVSHMPGPVLCSPRAMHICAVGQETVPSSVLASLLLEHHEERRRPEDDHAGKYCCTKGRMRFQFPISASWSPMV